MLLVTENAPAEKRGFYGAFAQAGAPAGLILANMAFLAVSGSLSDEAFMSWGWRIPFVLSIVLIALSLYVQLSLEDTPAFKELKQINHQHRYAPVDLDRRQPASGNPLVHLGNGEAGASRDLSGSEAQAIEGL